MTLTSTPTRAAAALTALLVLAAVSPVSAADGTLGPGTEVRSELFAWAIPSIDTPTFDTLRPYAEARRASFASWLPGPNAGMLISTRFGETAQLHRVDRPGGARQQLTFDKEPIRTAVSASWRGAAGIFYLKDVGGGEGYQLFFFDQEAGSHRQITTAPSRTLGLVLSHDRARLAFASTMRNTVDYDLYVLNLATDAKPRRVYDGKGFWMPTDWSPDGKRLLALNYISTNEASSHVINVSTGKARNVAPAKDKLTYTGSAHFAPDGSSVYIVSNRWGSFKQLGVVPLKGGEAKLLTGSSPWDVEGLAVDHTHGCVAFATNEGGRSVLHIHRASDWKAMPVPKLPVGVFSGLSFDDTGRRLSVGVSGPKSPGDVFAVELDGTGSKAATQWTLSEVGGLDTRTFVEPTLVRFPTFDKDKAGKQRTVPAFYFKPEGPGPFPVVVLIHGGPESQYRPRFSTTLQHWLRDLKIAVIAPNVRGSAGYGKEYLLLDNGMKREDSVKDIGALLDWVGTRSELDAKRVAVYGGSYGGYMVLASMARYADRLKCGAEIVGISNFVTFLNNTKEYRRDLRRAEYGDERDPAMRKHLEAISPTNLVGKMTKPLFIIQGANDPRVPASEAKQMMEALVARKVPAWYLLANDEGHGFRKKKNRDFYYAALSTFWRKHLL